MYHPLIDLARQAGGSLASDVTDIAVFYDPLLQRVPAERMGESRPTTRSSTDSTGVINSDSDESNDDTGND